MYADVSRALALVALLALASPALPDDDDDDDDDRRERPHFIHGPILHATYDGVNDDLLTAGLGKTGIAGAAPLFANPTAPTAAELRRNAIYNNYRALVDITALGGYGVLYGPNVTNAGVATMSEGKIAGDEFLAFADNGNGKRNVTLMVQVPASFDPSNPCIVTATSSGSRGIYGAIGTSGDWGLKQRCAVAYTDNGKGMGVHDLQNDTVNLIDGTRADADTADELSHFTARISDEKRGDFNAATPNRFAWKHAHSKRNPEKRWGNDTLNAIRFAFFVLNELITDARAGHYTKNNTLVIASSVSNGGAAALRAAEQDKHGLIDGVAVSEPNVNPKPGGAFSIVQGSQAPFTAHSKSLYDYATLVNLFQPCASRANSTATFATFGLITQLRQEARCASLKAKGLLTAATLADQATEAQRIINGFGILTEQNFVQPSHYSFSVPQGVSVTYANAYGKFSVVENLCGYSMGATDATGIPIAAAAATVAQIFANANGIPPTAGINLINNLSVGGAKDERASVSASTGVEDLNIDGALCLRALATDPRVQAGIAAVRASGNLRRKPTLIVNGRADAVIAPNHSSRAYFGLNQTVEGTHSRLRYYEVTNAQHLDSFNSFAGFNERFIPIHVYLVQALNLMYDHLKNGAALPPSQVVHTTPRGPGAPQICSPFPCSNVPAIRQTPAPADRIEFINAEVRIPD